MKINKIINGTEPILKGSTTKSELALLLLLLLILSLFFSGTSPLEPVVNPPTQAPSFRF
jgi:hypothetical protein